jgi:peptidoglycan/LPS O-acetylase OafA/YrhL
MARRKGEPHIYKDVDVTTDRLNDFALAGRSVQVDVLAKLRSQSADDSVATQLSIASLVLAIFVVIAAPLITVQPDPALASPWWARLILIVALVGVLLVALSPAMWDAAKGHVRRERAVVWLAAYEDELARRHRMRGRAARRWQREH